MTQFHSLRHILAGAVAAAGIVLVFVATSVTAYAMGTRTILTWHEISHGTFFFLFFGWPIAFVVTLALGFAWKRLTSRPLENERTGTLVLYSGGVGAASIPLIWIAFWGDATDLAPIAIAGLAAGAIGGAVYSRVLKWCK